MHPSLLVLAALWVLLSPGAVAQSFSVASSTPGEGATNVPLRTTVRFAFTQEVDVTTNWERSFVALPRDSVRLERVSLLLDGTGRPAVVEWQVEHSPQTDVTWLVHAVKSSGGADMTAPYVLRYTTASDIGMHTVSGTVSAPPARQSALAPAMRSAIASLIESLEHRDLGRPVFKEGLSSYADTHIGAAEERSTAQRTAASNPTYVYLLSGRGIKDAAGSVSAATVLRDGEADFAVDYVRDGSYWPLAVRYNDPEGTTIDAVGYYDADEDGTPDPVTILGAEVNGIDIQLATFPRVPASTYVSEAWGVASGTDPDQRLILIEGDYGLGLDGLAYTWRYKFYSPAQDQIIVVDVNPVESREHTAVPTATLRGARRIGDSFLDSDVAFEQALEDGGSQFISTAGEENVALNLQGGNLYWYLAETTDETFWRVRLLDQARGEDFVRFVGMDAEKTAGADEVPRSDTARLLPPYPNPARTEAILTFRLPSDGPVSLSVFDALGRRVALLLAGEAVRAGEHRVRWAPTGLASGLYIVLLETPAGLERTTITVPD